MFFLPSVRFQHEVAVDDDSDRKPRPDCQCRLDVEIPMNHFLSGLVQRIRWPPTQRLDEQSLLLPVSDPDPSS